MGLTITEKILREHLVNGTLREGEEIGIRIDQTLTQDATGTTAFLEFEALGLDRIKSELAVSYVDHNTIQVGPENADDHAYLQSVAARYGAIFSKPGNGICHQLHLERFGAPGKTLLGSDSHTPTAGGLGMFAIGAGGLDVAMAMGGAPFYLTVPRIIRIVLKGRLQPWVSAKDIVLKVLEVFSTKGNVGCVFEYAGKGLKNLDVPERATIANMGAECGVTTSVFPSDDITKAFLEAQERGHAWRELTADPDATYYKEVEMDLADLESLAAAPHSPGNVVTVSSLNGMKVDQVLIGSCTNSSYRDLKVVARILEGRKVSSGVSVGIAPGSRQVVRMLAKEGLLDILMAAGVRLLENACGFCIGNSLAPASNAVSLRTSNRNFEGRSGTPNAKVYLVSPEMAALAAIYGRVVDPRTINELVYPKIRQPRKYEIDDSMFIMPSEETSKVAVIRGPHMGVVPRSEPLSDTLDGLVAIKVGDKVTTDHIMPAGERLKYRSNVEIYSRYVFERIDSTFAERARQNKDKGIANIIVAGESYGQGSSREHAALCPMFLGVKAVVARSFERIHLTNLVNFGIVPLVLARAQDYEMLTQGDRLTMHNLREVVGSSTKGVLRNETRGMEAAVKLDLTARQRQMLLAGGLLNMIAKS